VENLRSLRKAIGYSQSKLGSEFGLAQAQIQNYEKGTYEPDIDTLKELAAFFETSVDYLIGFSTIRRAIEEVSEYALNKNEKELMDIYRSLTRAQRKNLLLLLKSFGEAK
jgi:transcriptional regulator with XRE-family HTH domain